MCPASSFSWAHWNHYVLTVFDILFSLWHCFYNHWTFWIFFVPPVCPVFFVSMRGVDLVDRFRTVWVAKNARPFGRKNGDFWDDENPEIDGINLDKAVPCKGIFFNMSGVPGSSIWTILSESEVHLAMLGPRDDRLLLPVPHNWKSWWSTPMWHCQRTAASLANSHVTNMFRFVVFLWHCLLKSICAFGGLIPK